MRLKINVPLQENKRVVITETWVILSDSVRFDRVVVIKEGTRARLDDGWHIMRKFEFEAMLADFERDHRVIESTGTI